jgi:hypothetical protein
MMKFTSIVMLTEQGLFPNCREGHMSQDEIDRFLALGAAEFSEDMRESREAEARGEPTVALGKVTYVFTNMTLEGGQSGVSQAWSWDLSKEAWTTCSLPCLPRG